MTPSTPPVSSAMASSPSASSGRAVGIFFRSATVSIFATFFFAAFAFTSVLGFGGWTVGNSANDTCCSRSTRAR